MSKAKEELFWEFGMGLPTYDIDMGLSEIWVSWVEI